MLFFVGIDPGLNGALALLDNVGNVHGIWDTPLIAKAGTKGRSAYDLHGIKTVVRQVQGKTIDFTKQSGGLIAGLEQVWSRPGESAVSGFTLGRGVTAWEMALACLDVPYVMVLPQRWKAEMLRGVEDKGKEASWLKARQIFPHAIRLLEAKRPGGTGRRIEDGRAEALLIAEFLRGEKGK